MRAPTKSGLEVRRTAGDLNQSRDTCHEEIRAGMRRGARPAWLCRPAGVGGLLQPQPELELLLRLRLLELLLRVQQLLRLLLLQ